MSDLGSNFILSCTDISLSFGQEKVIENLSFKIKKGKHTVFKGESGSGKSTLLKLMMGFISPSKGDIQFQDEGNLRKIRAETAWLPQDLDLGEGSVQDVMKKPFEFNANNSSKTSMEAPPEVLSKLGLRHTVWTQKYRSLSTGQRQRVGIAICYLLDKPLLLLDEPTSALDEGSKEKIIKLLLAHTNKTIVSTSHDPSWLQQADNIIELN